MKQDQSFKFYKVAAMCGHVGKRHYIPVDFAIKAEDAHEAAEKTRRIPRVKHNKKDAIISCEEISFEDYKILKDCNENDQFLKCRCRRDQLLIDGLTGRVLPYLDHEQRKRTFETREERIEYLLHREKIRRELDKTS